MLIESRNAVAPVHRASIRSHPAVVELSQPGERFTPSRSSSRPRIGPRKGILLAATALSVVPLAAACASDGPGQATTTSVTVERPTTIAPTTAPTTTAPATTAPKETPEGTLVQLDEPATTPNLQPAERVTDPTQLERQRIESMLPEGYPYRRLMNQVEQLGIKSRQVTPGLVSILTQPQNNRDIKAWEQVSRNRGVELHDLTVASVANTEDGRNILKWNTAVMENFMSQWGPELSGNSPAQLKKAARDFAARQTLGQYFHQNPAAFVLPGASENPGWLDLKFPEGERGMWQDVIQRVTMVAVKHGRLQTWAVPVPHGYDAVRATFGAPGSSQMAVDARIGPGGQVQRVSAHSKIAPKVEAAFEEINARGLSPAIRSFGGLYVYRSKRTNSDTSTHSWGIAIDLNSAEYPLGTDIAETDFGHHLIASVLGRYGFHQVEGDAHHFQYTTGF